MEIKQKEPKFDYTRKELHAMTDQELSKIWLSLGKYIDTEHYKDAKILNDMIREVKEYRRCKLFG